MSALRFVLRLPYALAVTLVSPLLVLCAIGFHEDDPVGLVSEGLRDVWLGRLE